MGTPTTKTELLIISEHELIKQHQAFDGLGRPQFIYTAPVWAKNGDPCLVTEIIYLSSLNEQIKGKKEGYTSWDINFVPDSVFTVDSTLLTSKTEIIVVNENELTKQYMEIDAQDRPFKIYEGPVWITTGDPCKVTEYIYPNLTSTSFKGKKEGYSLWDASWVPDSSFTVSF
jgi:hypothetical protein